jgi:hypothetical protein
MKTIIVLLLSTIILGCNQSSDSIQRGQQEKLLAEGTAQTGMPNIKNFRERKILKDIIEMRDQANLTTYTYLYSDMTGKLVFACDSIGYGIPSTTQYTNPEKEIHSSGGATMPQADPNGLFSGNSSGTWVLCKDPKSSKIAPVLFEHSIVVSQFKLN